MLREGDTLTAEQVPAIIDLDGYIEEGWTYNGNTLVNPVGFIPTGNMTFWVRTAKEETHTVTFINTDGSRTTLEVLHGSKVSSGDVPAIIDVDGLQELGWTCNGTSVILPETKVIRENTVF